MNPSACPVCARPSSGPFVQIDGLPVHVGVLWRTQWSAAAAPRGPMHMHLCAGCGYVWNPAFDPGLLDYEQDYDNALHGSALFRAFEAAMVEHLVERHDLHGRTIVEIGCGDGRFLGLLCEAGDNRGVGFEPGYRPERRSEAASDRVEVLAETYTADHPRRGADLVAARQVLEHMDDPVRFLRTIRAGIGDRATALYVDVPNGGELLAELAVWDLMYEHCGSWVEPALRTAAAAAGFAVTARPRRALGPVPGARGGAGGRRRGEGRGRARTTSPRWWRPPPPSATRTAAGCRAGVSGSPSTPATGVRWWPGAPADAA